MLPPLIKTIKTIMKACRPHLNFARVPERIRGVCCADELDDTRRFGANARPPTPNSLTAVDCWSASYAAPSHFQLCREALLIFRARAFRLQSTDLHTSPGACY